MITVASIAIEFSDNGALIRGAHKNIFGFEIVTNLQEKTSLKNGKITNYFALPEFLNRWALCHNL